MIKGKAISTFEVLVALGFVALGSWSISYWGDWKGLTYIRNQYLFVFINFALSSVVFWIALLCVRVPKHLCLPASLWAAVVWNTVFPSLIVYVGFLLLPIEVIFSGLLLSFRSSIATAKAVGISAITKVLVLMILQPKYLLDMFT